MLSEKPNARERVVHPMSLMALLFCKRILCKARQERAINDRSVKLAASQWLGKNIPAAFDGKKCNK